MRSVVVSDAGQIKLTGDKPYSLLGHADVRLSNDITAQLVVEGRLNESELVVDDLVMETLNGEAKGKGSIDFSKRRWQAEVTATNINPAPLYAPLATYLDGSISGSARAAGTGFGTNADFSVTVPELRGRLREESLNARGAVKHDATGWNIQDVAVSLGAAQLKVSGKYANNIDIAWTLEAPALERFLPTARGSLSTRGTVRGPHAAPQIEATATGRRLQYGTFSSSAINARIDAHLAGEAASLLDIDTSDLRIGNIALGSPRLTANMAASTPGSKQKYFSQRDRWQLDRFCVTWPSVAAENNTPHEFCGDAQWSRDGAWSLQAVSAELPMSLFDNSVPQEARYKGRWQARINAQAAAKQLWTGEATVQVTDASLTHQAIEGAEETVQLGTGKVEFVAKADAMLGTLRVVTPGTTSIDAKAHIQRQAKVALTASPLRAELHAKTGDANLLPLIFPDIDHSAGKLEIDVAAIGTIAVPELSGQVELRDGELSLYRYNLNLRDIGFSAGFVDNRLDFDGGANAGEGTMHLAGQLSWRNLEPVGYITFKGERLTVADIPEYKILASPDVRFDINGKRIDIKGEVLVPTARLTPSDLRGAVQLSPDARLTTAPPEAESRGFDVYSDLRVRLGDDVRIDTLGLQGRVGGSVTTFAEPDERPIGRGELNVSEGRYEAYGQKLDIDRGRLLFNASPLNDPGLDIQASRRIEDQKVGVNVRGTLRAPRMTLFAEPSLTQSQIVSYLLTGKPLSDLRDQDGVAVGNASNALALQGGGMLVSQVGRRLGLEEVGIESNGGNEASLVLGKFLSPRLFVSYGISLTESINTLKLRYTLSDRWRLKTESGQNQSADIEFRIER
ncbi:MAG: translocation/assembly module TamB domain-containing protein [Candidatus Obscuribacterales bacterium]|nr:translocation/assembly module TamB domain-containing protein [Steroidobacteraceae bacterium]